MEEGGLPQMCWGKQKEGSRVCGRWQPGGMGRGRVDNSGNLGKDTQGKLGRQQFSFSPSG